MPLWGRLRLAPLRAPCSEGKLVREIADLPLAEDIPTAFDSCRKGPRGIEWRDDKPAEASGSVRCPAVSCPFVACSAGMIVGLRVCGDWREAQHLCLQGAARTRCLGRGRLAGL